MKAEEVWEGVKNDERQKKYGKVRRMMEGEKGCRKGRVREENGRGKGGEEMKGEGAGKENER